MDTTQRRLTYWQQAIVDEIGCPPEDAGAIEELMRLNYGTLGGLTKASFRKEARICAGALALADKEDPEYAQKMRRGFGATED